MLPLIADSPAYFLLTSLRNPAYPTCILLISCLNLAFPAYMLLTSYLTPPYPAYRASVGDSAVSDVEFAASDADNPIWGLAGYRSAGSI